MTSNTQPPEFIVIGAMRAGTTALADCLARHPRIGMSRLKETDFFIAEKNYSKGIAWYQALFPVDKPIRGEASPNYAKCDVFKGVPQRIHAVRPDVKLIYIVRDPVDRFWSHYRHSFLVHGGLGAPQEVLQSEEGAHILASSMYHQQLSAYLDVFSSDQINVVDFDEFTAATDETLGRVCAFLGAPKIESFAQINKTNSAASLANTPGWALKLSQHPALAGWRAAAPAFLRTSLKNLLTTTQQTARQTPPIPPEARQRVSDAIVDDASRFRALTGRDFLNWSV